MEKNILEKLDDLIDRIAVIYQKVSSEWMGNEAFCQINLKKKCISKIRSDEVLWKLIWKYRDFITLNDTMLAFLLTIDEVEQTVNTRVKTKNSIEYKIENYILKHENGDVPVNKCLNDLFGIRIILSENIPHKDIQEHIKKKYPRLKCIDSSKNDYIATHVYFKMDNYVFPWELQIWTIDDKDRNLNSHRQYKQGYTKWERESRGGV